MTSGILNFVDKLCSKDYYTLQSLTYNVVKRRINIVLPKQEMIYPLKVPHWTLFHDFNDE